MIRNNCRFSWWCSKKIDTSMLAPVSEMGSAIPSKYLKGYVRLDNNQMLVVMDIEKSYLKRRAKRLKSFYEYWKIY